MSKDVILTDNWLESVRFDEHGLVNVVAQDHHTGRVLMVAWMSRESLVLTQQTGFATYYSRSRQKLWFKGEESGNRQRVLQIRLDCDGDVIVLQIEQEGGVACHTGRESCFYMVLEGNPPRWVVKDPVLKDPKTLYRQS